ncbi:hypothetical protein JZ751_027203 [Albula glossodonta]|uniref:ZP domain-containing protein n=1 Tax=Albula glossodonta TaxID=121402 RepID=A0A8T2NCL2_9TELE|nr:hypothetical protein JZ751_027203 [Albula glossodonta]
MSQLTLHLLLLALASCASASHYYGGTMTYVSKGQNPDGSFTVDIRYKETFRTGCSTYNRWSCASGNCGTITSLQSGRVDSSSAGFNWCHSDALMTRHLPSDEPFELRMASCCWITNTAGGVLSWRLLTHIDLGTRSDTLAPNRSPVTTVIPHIRLPSNCHRNINLLAHDPDGDQVRCRYGLVYNVECASCQQHSNFYLDEDACVLHHYGYTSVGARVFEFVVEDFPRQQISVSYSTGSWASKFPLSPATPSPSSTPYSTAAPGGTPLSRIPLQLIVRIDGAVPSCTEGVYLPRLLSPTPYNGEFFDIAVAQELEIHLKAQATHSQLSDFLISGPLNITEQKTFSGSVAESTLKWTPTENDNGVHFPICFIAESKAGASVYHSEMRCIIVRVGPRAGEANVICSETTMTVEVEKSSIIGLHADHLRLNDPSCTLMSNATHVIGSMSLNSCGTQLEEDDENLIFKNEITTFEDPTAVITRRHEVEIGFSCVYPKTGKVSLEFRAHKVPFIFTERGFGKFTYQFEFYHSSQFSQMVDPSTYPVEVPLKEMIYMEIESTSSIPNTVLFVESCRATPIDDPSYHLYYSIIENGCIIDDTVVVYAENGPDYKFGMEAFKFIGNYEEVFISCSVVLCKAGDPSTRCAQGCSNSTAAPAVHHHRRRSVALQTASHYISQGPLRLKRSSKESADTVRSDVSATSLNMNLVFIAGTLLALVAMVCGVVIFKSKQPKVKYQELPNSEF